MNPFSLHSLCNLHTQNIICHLCLQDSTKIQCNFHKQLQNKLIIEIQGTLESDEGYNVLRIHTTLLGQDERNRIIALYRHSHIDHIGCWCLLFTCMMDNQKYNDSLPLFRLTVGSLYSLVWTGTTSFTHLVLKFAITQDIYWKALNNNAHNKIMPGVIQGKLRCLDVDLHRQSISKMVGDSTVAANPFVAVPESCTFKPFVGFT